MNASQINKAIGQLYSEAGHLKKSFEKDPKYIKLLQQWSTLDKKMNSLRDAITKKHQKRLGEIDREITMLKMQKKSRSKHVINPKDLSAKFQDWWKSLYSGYLTFFKKKQVVWVDESEKFCLVKIPNSPPDWFLFQIGQDEFMHHSEGRLNQIKIAAMETKMKGPKIKL